MFSAKELPLHHRGPRLHASAAFSEDLQDDHLFYHHGLYNTKMNIVLHFQSSGTIPDISQTSFKIVTLLLTVREQRHSVST